MWYGRGVRPRAARGARDLGFAPAWLFGAVCPRSGTPASPRSCRPVLPAVSTAAMNLTLAELAYGLPPATHAVVVLDRAGWHTGAELKVPPNLTPVPLPACSPVELNPIEQVWRYLRDRYPSHRLSRDRGAVVEACCRAWNRPLAERGRVRSLAAFPWLPSCVTPS